MLLLPRRNFHWNTEIFMKINKACQVIWLGSLTYDDILSTPCDQQSTQSCHACVHCKQYVIWGHRNHRLSCPATLIDETHMLKDSFLKNKKWHKIQSALMSVAFNGLQHIELKFSYQIKMYANVHHLRQLYSFLQYWDNKYWMRATIYYSLNGYQC